MSRNQRFNKPNPTFRSNILQSGVDYVGERMTVARTMNKVALLLLIVMATAAYSFINTSVINTNLLFGAAIGGLICVVVSGFAPSISPITAPLYAICEGYVLGSISAIFEYEYAGIVSQAVIATMSVFLIMLVLYQTGIVRVSRRFVSGIMIATGALALTYIVDLILNMFGLAVPFLHDTGPVGLVISIFILILAIASLFSDFYFIETAETYGTPKYMEWYLAMGVIVTLVWIYVRVLDVLSRLRSRD